MAAWPSATEATEWPWRTSWRERRSRFASWSSTTRMRPVVAAGRAASVSDAERASRAETSAAGWAVSERASASGASVLGWEPAKGKGAAVLAP